MGNCFISLLLKNENNKSRPIYKIKGKFTCKVVDVYDGDTVTITFLNNCSIQKHKLRMYGYDSPEMKPRKNIDNRDSIINNAKNAKHFIENLILNQICIFESYGFDKYGRLLGILYLNNLNINELMIENGHGYPYFGGTKH